MTAGSAAPAAAAVAAPRTPKGMHDVLWPESARWEDTVARFAALVEGAGYGLTVTPVLEHAGVFLRGIGEGSEVVGKEMYVFEDRDGQMMALRPEGTAPIARAFVQHHPVPPWKAWYVAPSFRHENPQHGRYRQHHQLGRGGARARPTPTSTSRWSRWPTTSSPALGLRDVTLKLHSMGDGVCKPGYVALLGAFLAERADQLCPAHRARHLENPLRVLDCKTPGVPGGHRGRAPLPRPPLRPVRGPLRPGARRPRGARRRLHDRPPPRAGLRLLHPHHLRVRRRRARRGAERHRRRRPLRRAGRAAGRRADAGHRVRHRDRAGAARLRRRGRVRHRRRGGGAAAARLRDRHRRRGVGRRRSRPSCAGPACGSTGPSTGAP